MGVASGRRGTVRARERPDRAPETAAHAPETTVRDPGTTCRDPGFSVVRSIPSTFAGASLRRKRSSSRKRTSRTSSSSGRLGHGFSTSKTASSSRPKSASPSPSRSRFRRSAPRSANALAPAIRSAGPRRWSDRDPSSNRAGVPGTQNAAFTISMRVSPSGRRSTAAEIEAHPIHARVAREPGAPEAFAGASHAAALLRVDAVERADPRAGPARAHLDHGDHGPVSCHHVQLEATDAQVRLQDLEPCGGEVGGDRLLGSGTPAASFGATRALHW